MSSTFTRLSKLRGLPPRQVLQVLQYKCAKVQRRLRQDIRVRLIRNVWPGWCVPRIARLRDDIRFFGLADWLGREEDLSRVLNQVVGLGPGGFESAAERCCAHVFDHLGSGPVNLGQTIDWHRDFKSGVKWEPSYFSRIKEIELNDASDIKVPWELSRCQHFTTLGIAYSQTRDEKYAREFVAECQDWIEQNPPYHGVNWHCAMEVAIRAISRAIWTHYHPRDKWTPPAGAEKF